MTVVYEFRSKNQSNLRGFTRNSEGKNLPPQSGLWDWFISHEMNHGETRDTDMVLMETANERYYLTAAKLDFDD